MQVQKLRGSADANGLIPAGRYFQSLARSLDGANARETARQRELDAEDRDLEALYRHRSAALAEPAAAMQ